MTYWRCAAGWRCGSPIPSSSPWIERHLAKTGSLVPGDGCPSTVGRSARLSSARKRRFMPTASFGKPMADRETEVLAKIASGISGLNAWAWDKLGKGDPFLSHAFLSALEDSGSVGTGTGWTPAPILIEDEGRLVGAAPAYLKSHSQGEYVFDHGWVVAWERAGGAYYPKLQVAVPFTPVPGPRLLGSRPQQLLAALEAVTVQNDISSAHITFIDDAGAAECRRRGWLMRDGIQYHWFNRGYSSFED